MQPTDLFTYMMAVKAGDQSAFRHVFDLCYANVYRCCFQFLRNKDAAKDATSQTFIKTYEKIAQYNPQISQPQTWIKNIAVHQCLDILKSIKSKNNFSIDDDFEIMDNASDNLDTRDFLHKTLEIVESMDSPMKEVVKLYTIEEFSHKEIAEILNISEGLSKVLLSNARKKIKNLTAQKHVG